MRASRQSNRRQRRKQRGDCLFVLFVCFCSKPPSMTGSRSCRTPIPTAEPSLLENPKLQGSSPKRKRRFAAAPLFGDVVIQFQKSPAKSVRARRDGRPCHGAPNSDSLRSSASSAVSALKNQTQRRRERKDSLRMNNTKNSPGQCQRTAAAEHYDWDKLKSQRRTEFSRCMGESFRESSRLTSFGIHNGSSWDDC